MLRINIYPAALTLNIPGGNIQSSQRIAAAIRDHPPLFNNQRNKQQTALPLPATGDRRPASRQARKPAHDRINLDGCSMVKTQNRVNDPASNAPRHSGGNRTNCITARQPDDNCPSTWYSPAPGRIGEL